MKTKHMTKLFAGFSVALAVQTAFAGNITDINVSTLPDNQKIIKIRLVLFNRITDMIRVNLNKNRNISGFCFERQSSRLLWEGMFS